MVWKETHADYHPNSISRQIAVLYGDPNQAGSYVLTGKIAAGTTQKLRQLDHNRFAYLVSGTQEAIFIDEQGNEKKLLMNPGTFYFIPAGVKEAFNTQNESVQWLEWAEGPRTYTVVGEANP